MKHEAQHPDSPTWCVHCGTFDIYFATGECSPVRDRRFDSNVESNFERIATGLFGKAEAQPLSEIAGGKA